MQYSECTPRDELGGVVRCIWQLAGPGGDEGTPERVLPDGCSEIVLNRADRFFRWNGDSTPHRQAEVLLVGQLRGAISIAPSGVIDLLGIRFEPGGLYALLGIPMHELTDRDVSLRQANASLYARLQEAARVEGASERVRKVEAALSDQLARRAPRGQAWLVAAAVQRLNDLPATTEAVAQGLRISRRSLERAFRQCVGLSPKQYLRIQRLQSVVSRVEAGSSLPSWASLAVEHGYFDQPHLIREFGALAGTTPARYLAEQSTFSDLFIQGTTLSHSSNP